jgi:hypothetical protein
MCFSQTRHTNIQDTVLTEIFATVTVMLSRLDIFAADTTTGLFFPHNVRVSHRHIPTPVFFPNRKTAAEAKVE